MIERDQEHSCLTDPPAFDYEGLPASVAQFLRGHARRIREDYTKSIMRAGAALIEAKRHLSHGQFIRWLRTEVGVPTRTAQAYMRVATWAKGKSSRVANLPPALLYLISRGNTPEEFVVNLLDQHERGERIDLRIVRAELKAIQDSRLLRLPKKQLLATDCITPEGGSIQPRSEAEVAVRGVIAILAKNLPSSEFEQVRHIMTMKSLLGDQKLGQYIAAAFTAMGHSLENNYASQHGGPQHVGRGMRQVA